MKKIVSIILSLIIMISVFSGLSITASAVSVSQAKAVEWAKGRVNVTTGDGQCVALVSAYYSFLGVEPVTGDGCEYATNALPSGWERIPYTEGFSAKPGDIAVWTWNKWAEDYGHVAIVTSGDASSFSYIDQGKTYGYVGNEGSKSYHEADWVFYGVIRPDFPEYSNSTAENEGKTLTVSAPKISVSNVLNGKKITLTTKTNGASVYYKLGKNGKQKKYSKPFKITATQTIYALAKKEGCKNSKTVSKKVTLNKLKKVTGVKATAASTSTVKVSFKSVSGAGKYAVVYSAGGNKASSVYSKGTSITLKNLQENTKYSIKVCACANGMTHGDFSNSVNVKTKKNAENKLVKKLIGKKWIPVYLTEGDYNEVYTFDNKGYVTVKWLDYSNQEVEKRRVKYKTTKSGIEFEYGDLANSKRKCVLYNVDASTLVRYKIENKEYGSKSYGMLCSKFDDSTDFYMSIVPNYWVSPYFKKSFGNDSYVYCDYRSTQVDWAIARGQKYSYRDLDLQHYLVNSSVVKLSNAVNGYQTDGDNYSIYLVKTSNKKAVNAYIFHKGEFKSEKWTAE